MKNKYVLFKDNGEYLESDKIPNITSMSDFLLSISGTGEHHWYAPHVIRGTNSVNWISDNNTVKDYVPDGIMLMAKMFF